MARFSDEELKEKIRNGFIVESEDEMTETYKKALITQLTVQGDTELISAPSYFNVAKDAPSTNTMVSAMAIIQDELGHANIAYRLLEDLGVDREYLLYRREPKKFKHPYGFDQWLDNWAELVVANGLFDRAGITLLGDVYRNTSYGPLKAPSWTTHHHRYGVRYRQWIVWRGHEGHDQRCRHRGALNQRGRQDADHQCRERVLRRGEKAVQGPLTQGLESIAQPVDAQHEDVQQSQNDE